MTRSPRAHLRSPVPPPPREAARESFVDPRGDPVLAEYLKSVLQWHGYIRFLGLPHLRENPDVLIDRLYVEPRLSRRPLSPDAEPEAWKEAGPILDTMTQHPRLLLLGDPGTGKSTLVSWLTWQFARRPKSPWTTAFGPLLPLPVILREIPLGPGLDWEGLVQAFLGHEMWKGLDARRRLDPFLERGQALLLLDGLDEIGSVEVRKSLRQAVLQGMARHPACRWLLTSRLVGYDQVPFHRLPGSQDAAAKEGEEDGTYPLLEPEANGETSPGPPGHRRETIVAELAYVAPFHDEQIEAFTRNWFTLREAVPERAAARARELLAALRGHATTLRLARVPNLLTMMALIYRVRARLPHGRALLYHEIAQAYLQSIDEYRQLQELDYPLAQKKRWLARVAFQMQLRRSKTKNKNDPETREILASAGDVRKWITEAMAESGHGGDDADAGRFVDYIGRRSGLLLPRGAGQFAFMHLSFQEYFAACFLEEQITSPLWLQGGETAPGTAKEDLRRHAHDATWRETLLFLFGLLAERPGWPQALAEVLFGKGFDGVKPDDPETEDAAVLLAHLATDPHSGLSRDLRRRGFEICWAWEVKRQKDLGDTPLWRHEPRVAQALVAADSEYVADVWATLLALAPKLAAFTLKNSAVKDLEHLQNLKTLKTLRLDHTAVQDLKPLQNLTNLERLFLGHTAVQDLKPLQNLTNLERLFLGHAAVQDLKPLQNLTNLSSLVLNNTAVQDLKPLQNLTNLERLYLDNTAVQDLKLLQNLTNLEGLYLDNTAVQDLKPLQNLTNLKDLGLDNTAVQDLKPLQNLIHLKTLYLANTRVSRQERERFHRERRRAGLSEVAIVG